MLGALTFNLAIMRRVVCMGNGKFYYVKTSFITFDSEIGYEECLKMKDFKFGEDILRVEPGQDKGSIPTSV